MADVKSDARPTEAECPPGSGSRRWSWWICALLLFASTINYMDRQTLSATSTQIKREFDLAYQQYGALETVFGLAFAAGAIYFGWLADRTNIRWLYPTVLCLWSLMGFATGLVQTYAGLLLCRLFLGLFEAGHWPCALRTTQRLLPPRDRLLGNSVLQSGTAIGAIVTPQIIKWMVDENQRGGWRPAFTIIGGVGLVWIAFWLLSVRSDDLKPAPLDADRGPEEPEVSFFALLSSPPFLLTLIVVMTINLCWHQFRVWMLVFLTDGRGYTRDAALDWVTWFNIATDVGCLAAGFFTAYLGRRGWSVHSSRTLVFGISSLLTAAGVAVLWLPKGRGLECMLLIVGLGALGLFPCYYSMVQAISARNTGKISGVLGASAWIVSSLWHWTIGGWIDVTKSHDWGMAIAAILPLLAWPAVWWFRGDETVE